MKTFLSFVNKELKHIFRDRRTMIILFGMPLVQMLLFGFAITTDVRNVRTVAVTSSMDKLTQQVIERLDASEYFDIVAQASTAEEAEMLIRNTKADMAVVFCPALPTTGTGVTHASNSSWTAQTRIWQHCRPLTPVR